MYNVSRFFDHSGAVARPPLGRFAREYWALVADNPDPPAVSDLPDGNGRVVLVLPGFLCTDQMMTGPLRRFLDSCGFRSYGWDYGVNWGPTEGAIAHLRARLAELFAIGGQPIAVVGVSLGGLLARDLAYDCPEMIRHVVTLASPFRLPTASTFELLIRLCSPFYSPRLSTERLSEPLPVPSTAFFTRDDGVVAWRSCRSDDPDCLNIEVSSAHMTICRNPAVLSELVRRLAEDFRP